MDVNRHHDSDPCAVLQMFVIIWCVIVIHIFNPSPICWWNWAAHAGFGWFRTASTWFWFLLWIHLRWLGWLKVYAMEMVIMTILVYPMIIWLWQQNYGTKFGQPICLLFLPISRPDLQCWLYSPDLIVGYSREDTDHMHTWHKCIRENSTFVLSEEKTGTLCLLSQGWSLVIKNHDYETGHHPYAKPEKQASIPCTDICKVPKSA